MQSMNLNDLQNFSFPLIIFIDVFGGKVTSAITVLYDTQVKTNTCVHVVQ